MRKKPLLTFALILMLLGLGIVVSILVGQTFLQADVAVFAPSEQATFRSFLSFGGAMIGASIILFIILARL